ncbi:formate dehydrogenase subunit gamma [Variovorax sp. dw_308]|uniref:formate dehydrogenase subunit gamma n=1 Tax=Variovorax sp. dw_308 TaxID=2721546 RepID=UPI001C45E164|nr:formate dehydrogenase subunit gamma [Variovorax sp. dw_308]
MKHIIRRYTDLTRANHWFVAGLFICAGLSGLAIFHPALFFFSNLFGGGQWTRILHPFFGLLMVFGFALLFIQFWHENLWKPIDTQWVRKAPDLIIKGDEDAMPPVGKYNAGQKGVFWLFTICLLLLLVTGFMFWRPWFVDYFPITLRRIAVLVHSLSAIALILGVITHVYAAIWVKGSVHAMMRGTVTYNWARKHHLLWYREIVAEESAAERRMKG